LLSFHKIKIELLFIFSFAGNVGDSKALADVVKSWALPSRLSSTKELLLVRTTNLLFKYWIYLDIEMCRY
jgi:hypothetical protein